MLPGPVVADVFIFADPCEAFDDVLAAAEVLAGAAMGLAAAGTASLVALLLVDWVAVAVTGAGLLSGADAIEDVGAV